MERGKRNWEKENLKQRKRKPAKSGKRMSVQQEEKQRRWQNFREEAQLGKYQSKRIFKWLIKILNK